MPESKTAAHGPSREAFLAAVVFCVASATLLLQIVQTRIYAVMFWNHLVYFIISVALLGFGISGTWLAFGSTTPLARVLTLRNAAIGFVLSAIFSSLVVPQLGISFGAVLTSKWNLLPLMTTYSSAVLPYFFAGWILGVIYRDHAARIHFLYFADLIGAGLGCLLVLALIRPFGAVALVLLACALVSFPIFLGEYREKKSRWLLFLAGLNALILVVLFITRNEINSRIVPDATKGFNILYKDLERGDERIVEFTEWNSIARTDVVGTKHTRVKRIFIDGDAYTGIELNAVGAPPPFDREKEPLVPHKTPYVQCGRVRSRYPAGLKPAPVRLASRRVASPWKEGSNPRL